MVNRLISSQYLVGFMVKHKLDHKRLAVLCGYSWRTVYRWLDGSRSIPRSFCKWIELWECLSDEDRIAYINLADGHDIHPENRSP
jgi:hypothetical protein